MRSHAVPTQERGNDHVAGEREKGVRNKTDGAFASLSLGKKYLLQDNSPATLCVFRAGMIRFQIGDGIRTNKESL